MVYDEFETVDYEPKKHMEIRLKKIKPFINVCRVTKQREECNIEVDYMPRNKCIELGAYRKFFAEQVFEMYIEEMAETIFNALWEKLDPRALRVRIYLDDESLTPWVVEVAG